MNAWLRILLACLPLPVMAQQPVADMHLHYKWSQRDVTSPADAAAVLRQQGIVMGVVIGTPAELALELRRQAPDRVMPIFSPYRDGGIAGRSIRTSSRARARHWPRATITASASCI
jgi:hypothetical protein